MPNLIAIGRITKSVGIRGELKIFPLTDDPQRYYDLHSVWVGEDEQSAQEKQIQSCRLQPNAVYLYLQGISDRDSSDRFRGKFVFIPQELKIKPPPGKHFIHDIIGLEVKTEEGVLIGVVKDVQHYPAQDIWIVKTQSKEILIPAVKEFIRRVDLKQGHIIIRSMEGLIDPD